MALTVFSKDTDLRKYLQRLEFFVHTEKAAGANDATTTLVGGKALVEMPEATEGKINSRTTPDDEHVKQLGIWLYLLPTAFQARAARR